MDMITALFSDARAADVTDVDVTVAAAWECETDSGWSEYGADIAGLLESALDTRAAVSWDAQGFTYSVDWDTMQQVNKTTRKRRAIRRRYLVYEDDIPALDAAAARRASSPGTPTLTAEQRAEMRALRDEAVRRELERARARAE